MRKFFIGAFLVLALVAIPISTCNDAEEFDLYCSDCMNQISVHDIAYETDNWIICRDCMHLYCMDEESGQVVPLWYLE